MSPPGAKQSPKRKAKASSETAPHVCEPPASDAQSSSDIYSSKYAEIARTKRSRGATDAELYEALGISADTLAIWQEQNSEFAEACALNKTAMLKRLEDRLYEQALGRTITEKTIVEANGKRKVTIVKKEVPPDKDVAKFLMTNMDPKNWRLRPEPPPQEQQESDLRTLLSQMNEQRGHRNGPVAMYPGEVDDAMLKFYGGVLPERAKGWKHNPRYNPELAAEKKENVTKE